jgi:hypothetical protein
MGNTQALPGAAVTGDAAAAPEQHEVIYEQALRRIAALDETWQEAVRGVAVPAEPAVPEAPAAVATVAVVVPPAPRLGQAAAPALPPLPRPPVTATAEITAIAAGDTEEAVLARAAAPRWRRSLAS